MLVTVLYIYVGYVNTSIVTRPRGKVVMEDTRKSGGSGGDGAGDSTGFGRSSSDTLATYRSSKASDGSRSVSEFFSTRSSTLYFGRSTYYSQETECLIPPDTEVRLSTVRQSAFYPRVSKALTGMTLTGMISSGAEHDVDAPTVHSGAPGEFLDTPRSIAEEEGDDLIGDSIYGVNSGMSTERNLEEAFDDSSTTDTSTEQPPFILYATEPGAAV